jgi:hypothetical protein
VARAIFVDVTDCEIKFLASAPHLFFKLGLKGKIVFHGLTFEATGTQQAPRSGIVLLCVRVG